MRALGQSNSHNLHGDVEAGHVVRFEHDFCGVFAVFRRVQRRLGEGHVVLFWLAAPKNRR